MREPATKLNRAKSRKISVSDADFALLGARAKRLHGNHFAALFSDLNESLRREEAMDALVETLRENLHATDDEDFTDGESREEPTRRDRRSRREKKSRRN